MKIQGEDGASAGHAGLIDALHDVFAPGKEHMKEQKQYDERVGRKVTTNSGKPLDFGENSIDLVVEPGKNEVPQPSSEPPNQAEADKRKSRPHRQRSSKD